MQSIIFYFSGTGNSLFVAKDIASKLDNCQIVSMTGKIEYILEGHYSHIGFVYPTYFQGMPVKAHAFISKLKFQTEKTPYVFAVATCGTSSGNALPQIEYILNKKGITLNYSNTLKMFANYVVMYNMSKKVKQSIEKSKLALEPIMVYIINNMPNQTKKPFKFLNIFYNNFIQSVKTKDENYNISNNCNGCGICEKVCPVDNIKLENGMPSFKHHCEQCVACIQWCPQKAINYKKVTINRGRYTNPEISVKDFINALCKNN